MKMKATEIVLVRHGQTVWNLEGRRQGHRDSPLSEHGLFQAQRIADRLSERKFAAIHSSDLGRAYQTAERIARTTGNQIRTDPRLRERNYGIFEGLTGEEVNRICPEEFSLFRKSGPDFVIPKGESTTVFHQRCISCLEELACHHEGENFIVVTHLGVLNCLFRHILGVPADVSRRFEVPEGSLNLVHYTSGKWNLITWGDISHLDGDKNSAVDHHSS
jgi:probable phosphoglycerate mutase